MPIQQSFISNSKTLCGIPRDIGLIEVVIEFQDDDPTNESSTNQLDDTRGARPNDRTVAWYHSLGEAEKQIKGLRLHETWSHPPFAVLSMNDNSFLLFELAPKVGDSGGDFKSINVTRLTSLGAESLAPSTIRVDFSPTPDDGKAWVDLKFAIAVCCGFFNHTSPSPKLYDAPVCQRLFALALFVSVVRQRLPIDRSLIKNISTITAVDNFCGEILSREHAGQLLWVTTIAEEVHQVVSRGIHEAAVEHLKCSIPVADKDVGGAKARIARLVVAWLESMVDKGKPSVSDLWDNEWDQHWDSEWRKNWARNWSAVPERTPLVQHLIDRLGDQFAHKVPATSVLSGSAAGRAMIEVALVSSIIPPGHLPTIDIPVASQTEEPSKTPALIPLASPVEEQGKRMPPIIEPEDKPASVPAQPGDEYNWFDFWHSVRRPDLKKQGEWLPTWEAANNMAWVLGWEDHSKKDEKPPASPPGPRGEIQPQGIHLHPGGNAKAGLPTPDLPAFPDLGRFFLGWLNRSRVEVAPDDGDTLKPDLRKLSGAAWIEAHDSNPGVGAYTKESGGKVYESLEEEIESSVSGVAVPSRDECVTVFENILKQTWQKCWERAWEKVMNNTLKELNTWTSNVKSTSLASNIRNSKLNGYSDLCHYMKSGDSEEENHWTIRSAFKASNLLYRVLEHSIPRCYEGAMTILYFPDRPALYDIASLTPTSKLKGITKAIHQDREQLLTHIELQERIRYLASTNRNRILGFPDTRVPKFPDNRTAIENIEAIWKMANSVDAKLEFMGSKDTIQPWLRQKEQTKKRQGDKNVITFARVRAQHVWQKTLRDVRVHTRKIVGSTPAQPTDSAPVAENA